MLTGKSPHNGGSCNHNLRTSEGDHTMRWILAMAIATTGLSVYAQENAEPADGLNILVLTTSQGFEHSVVRREEGALSLVERVIAKVGEGMGATVTTRKNASLINAENLANYDVVIFYTTGDPTQGEPEGYPPMPEDGVEALQEWIANGGGFIGFHAATDTFRAGADNPPTPYVQMIGAEFEWHGAQFTGTIRLTNPDHPTVANFPQGWTLHEEWYAFAHLNEEDIHVIGLLQIGDERGKQERYNVPDYPMIWCREIGAGRLFYNGMGHREDVWEHPIFQAHIEDAIRWAAGEGEAMAEPNYAEVVPATIEESLEAAVPPAELDEE
jgi:type 1 glutamine amidotransferase